MSAYRISPSQINLFLNEPAIWILNRFFGVYGDFGASAKRGNCVELGLNKVLLNGLTFDEALGQVLHIYDTDMEEIYDEKKEAERENIGPMLEQAIDLFLNIDPPQKTQIRIEPDVLDLPILGIADYDMGEYMVDLKTTSRCPSCVENLSSEHIRQTTIYYLGSNKPQKLAYVTPKKNALYEVTKEQMETAEKEIRAAAEAMRAAYDIEEKQGKDALAVLYPPRDTKNFYWDNKTLNAAQGIWF